LGVLPIHQGELRKSWIDFKVDIKLFEKLHSLLRREGKQWKSDKVIAEKKMVVESY